MKKLTKLMNLLFMTNIITRLTVPVIANENELPPVEPNVSQPVESTAPEESYPQPTPETSSSEAILSVIEEQPVESLPNEEVSADESPQESSESTEAESEEIRHEVVDFEVTDWVEIEGNITESTTSIRGNIDYIWEAMRRNNLTDALWKELLQENIIGTNKTIKLLSDDGSVIAETTLNSDLSFEFSNLNLENMQNITFVMSDIELNHQEDNVMTDVKIMPKQNNLTVQPDVDAFTTTFQATNTRSVVMNGWVSGFEAYNINNNKIAIIQGNIKLSDIVTSINNSQITVNNVLEQLGNPELQIQLSNGGSFSVPIESGSGHFSLEINRKLGANETVTFKLIPSTNPTGVTLTFSPVIYRIANQGVDAMTSASLYNLSGDTLIKLTNEEPISQNTTAINGYLDIDSMLDEIKLITGISWKVMASTAEEYISQEINGRGIHLTLNNGETYHSTVQLNSSTGRLNFSFDNIDLSNAETINISFGPFIMNDVKQTLSAFDFTSKEIAVEAVEPANPTLSVSPDPINFNVELSFSDVIENNSVTITADQIPTVTITDIPANSNWSLHLQHDNTGGLPLNMTYGGTPITNGTGVEIWSSTGNSSEETITLKSDFTVNAQNAETGSLGTFKWILFDTQ